MKVTSALIDEVMAETAVSMPPVVVFGTSLAGWQLAEVAAHVYARRDLVAALDALMVAKADERVPITSIRHALALLGLNPSEAMLRDELLNRGAWIDRPRSEGRRPRVWVGLAFRAGALDRLKTQLMERWDTRLEEDRLGVVRAGKPTEDEALPPARRPPATYYEVMAEYFHRCDWSKFASVDRLVVARQIDTGESRRMIAKVLGLSPAMVQRVLQRHMAKAGWSERR